MKPLINISDWTMDRLIGWFDPCLDLVQDDMDTFTLSYPPIELPSAFEKQYQNMKPIGYIADSLLIGNACTIIVVHLTNIANAGLTSVCSPNFTITSSIKI